jgi:FtsP/CotA-like multicopper oxidase with cupredoxin domain
LFSALGFSHGKGGHMRYGLWIDQIANSGKRRASLALSLLLPVLVLGTLALPSQALASSSMDCPRPSAGSQVIRPPDIYSSNGVLKVAFKYSTTLDNKNRTLFCFTAPSTGESPTLHVKPGDTIKITLTNTVPVPPPSAPSEVVSDASSRCGAASMTLASVNIHFHGTNTAPSCHSDDVIHTLVNSGQTFDYDVKIPANEPPGLYWYHPHVHGLSEAAVQGGASGVIEVEGIADIQPAVNGLPERYLILRDQLVANPGANSSGKQPAWDVSINYVPVPYPLYQPAIIRMQTGGRELWRVTNASADTFFDLQLIYDGKKQPLQIVALDGVPLGSQDGTRKGTVETQTDLLLSPAGRGEFIMDGPKGDVRNAMLITRAVNTGPGGDLDPKRPLARILTASNLDASPRSILHMGYVNVQRFEGLAQANVTATRKLYFSEGPVKFFITVDGAKPQVFKASNPPAITTTQGSVEDWTIENRTSETHAFHIHQIHFLLLAVNGVAVPKDKQQFYDTFPIGYWSGKGAFPNIKVRMDFRGADTGDFVYHCHILEHEDGGMMAIIRVLPHSTADTRRMPSHNG